jgi:hypothetical protein
VCRVAVAAGVVPDTESAGARSGDGLAAALEENARLRAENAELPVALAQVLARDAARDAEPGKLRAERKPAESVRLIHAVPSRASMYRLFRSVHLPLAVRAIRRASPRQGNAETKGRIARGADC